MATNALPPFLIAHGDADPVVSFHQSELLFDALEKAGGTVRLHCVKGAGHGQGFGGKEIDGMGTGFKDGRLTKDEFKGPPQLFLRLDRNGDGVLTKEDFERVP